MARLTARQEGTSLPAAGAWAGTGGTQRCARTCVVTSPSSARATPALSTRCPAPGAAETWRAPCLGAVEDNGLSVLARPVAALRLRQRPAGLLGSASMPLAPVHPLWEEL